jgi:hypothetical protein
MLFSCSYTLNLVKLHRSQKRHFTPFETRPISGGRKTRHYTLVLKSLHPLRLLSSRGMLRHGFSASYDTFGLSGTLGLLLEGSAVARVRGMIAALTAFSFNIHHLQEIRNSFRIGNTPLLF